MIGFAGMLRPAEITRLAMEGLIVLVGIGMGTRPACFVLIGNPKMRRLGFGR